MRRARFAIGKYSDSDTGSRWVMIFDGEEDAGLLAQYVTSFQWSMAMMTLGAIDVVCMNTAERAFYVFCLPVGLTASSMLVSTMSATMVESHMVIADQKQKLRLLRRYLHHNHVKATLNRAIQLQASRRLHQNQPLIENDVLALSVLTARLQCELRFEILGWPLLMHPLFRFIEAINEFWCRRILVDGINSAFYHSQDDVFMPSKLAVAAYFVMRGEMVYTQEPSSSLVEMPKKEHVLQNMWICKAALWVDWTHVGLAKSERRCEVLRLNTELLHQSVVTHPQVCSLVANYSKQLVQSFASAAPPLFAWPDDL